MAPHEIEDRESADRLLERMYATHHRREQAGGQRLRQAFLEETRARLFRSWIGRNKDVLDLGCRDGTLTRHFTDGNRVTGADIDSEALAFAHREHGIQVRKANLNAALPFTDDSFDVVILAETLEHLPYPRITLEEIRRVLRSSGLFIGNVPLFYHLHGRWRVVRGKRLDNDPTHCQYFSHDSVRALLEEFFSIEAMVPLKGGRWAELSMRLFARNVAFRCRKT
ncbi:MAG: class I SAM-dependent methyltransferase [Candidatus Rokuibacteriota bacterium]